MASLPVFEAELSRRRSWLSPAEVAEAFAIYQSVPGVVIVNFAVFTALRISGKRAAILAAIASALPAFVVLLAVAAFFGGHWNNRWVVGALSGLRPAVIALLVGAAIRLGREGRRSPLFLLAAAAAAALLRFGILGPVPLVLLGALGGLLFHAARRACGRKSTP